MNRLMSYRRTQASLARGLTMIEAVVSIAVVGLTLTAALTAVTTAQAGAHKTAEYGRGLLLAQDMMSEIIEQPYADPDSGLALMALDAGEDGVADRSLRDDVDDYNGWTASPPQHRDGTVMTDLQGWERSVTVTWVNPQDLSQTVGSNQGIQRIVVTVTDDGRIAARLSAFRSSALKDVRNVEIGLKIIAKD